MAHDDMFAILLLLQHPGVQVEAITVAGTGEAHCRPGVENALGLVHLNGKSGIPVACGRETPLEGDHVFPEPWRTAADEAYGVALPEGGKPSPLAAADLIADVAMNSNDRVSIVALGPLTNVAEVLQARPEIAGKIDSIYVMGGAVNVAGNVGAEAEIDNPHAEWNFYIDPAAADIVFESGVPVTLVPLDATREVPVTRGFHRSLSRQARSPEAEFVHEMLNANLDFVDSGGFQFWDTLTAAAFADESLVEFDVFELQVVLEDGPASGHTRPTEGGAPIRVATGANRKRFEALFVDVLNGQGPQ
jgi:pyrimidine-specific ribonucleoside hydrolase